MSARFFIFSATRSCLIIPGLPSFVFVLFQASGWFAVSWSKWTTAPSTQNCWKCCRGIRRLRWISVPVFHAFAQLRSKNNIAWLGHFVAQHNVQSGRGVLPLKHGRTETTHWGMHQRETIHFLWRGSSEFMQSTGQRRAHVPLQVPRPHWQRWNVSRPSCQQCQFSLTDAKRVLGKPLGQSPKNVTQCLVTRRIPSECFVSICFLSEANTISQNWSRSGEAKLRIPRNGLCRWGRDLYLAWLGSF